MTEPQIIERFVSEAARAPAQPRPFLFILVGVPGSGKSTVAGWLGEAVGAIPVATDDLKRLLREGRTDPVSIDASARRRTTAEELRGLIALQQRVLQTLMVARTHLVADCNSDKSVFREALAGLARAQRYEALCIHCHCRKETAVRRMEQRRRSGGLYVEPHEIDARLAALEPPPDAIALDSDQGLLTCRQTLLSQLKPRLGPTP